MIFQSISATTRPPAALVGMEAAQLGCQLKVGIVGAGIAGLSAAIGLCKAGHEVEVKDP